MTTTMVMSTGIIIIMVMSMGTAMMLRRPRRPRVR